MQIPVFTLPSNPEKEALFRMPKVSDAMSWANASPDTEEANITRYLREMLVAGQDHDPQLWTAQDRWTALWWIYINSRLDPTVTVQYECEHCATGDGKDTHFYDCDMSVLIDTIGLLTVEPFTAVEIPVDGEIKQWLIRPLDGRAMEHLERVRLALPPDDDPTYQNELDNLEILELAHQAHLADQPEDFMEAAALRFELIQEMAVDTEFSVLAANVELARRSLAHGLEMRIQHGETTLMLPDHPCPTIAKEKGEAFAPKTRLFTPFRPRDFFPVIRPRRMGNAG
ncbi:TPA: hypothetical protein JG832_002491 [Enterobacter hormaechei subsp. xiangfangensis]|nr:hypothetical protein [Enterobacter hormaechei subsp. xiangfangensis]HAV1890626.1 hypothetical protein [Enterobacter hormaechei subsp. xiangfangensis]